MAEVVSPAALHHIADACVRECVRQRVGVGDAGRLLIAYDWAMKRADRLPTEDDVVHLHAIIEGADLDVVLDDALGRPYAPARHRYRVMNLEFPADAADWSFVAGAVERMFGVLDRDVDPGEFVRAFLRIHPWDDGNGRTGFVLYNWLGGTLHNPQPLPDYFGEEVAAANGEPWSITNAVLKAVRDVLELLCIRDDHDSCDHYADAVSAASELTRHGWQPPDDPARFWPVEISREDGDAGLHCGLCHQTIGATVDDQVVPLSTVAEAVAAHMNTCPARPVLSDEFHGFGGGE